jgi:hypothetical protein
MNVSLSPNKTLGRMLHSFTATAYEIEANQFGLNLQDNSHISYNNSTGFDNYNFYSKVYYSSIDNNQAFTNCYSVKLIERPLFNVSGYYDS